MNASKSSPPSFVFLGSLFPMTRQVGGRLHLAWLFFLWPMWLLSQDSDCWFSISDQGKNGFVNQAGKLAFPLQPYALSGIRDGLLVANEQGGDQGGWIIRMEPYRIAPVFPYGRSGLMNLQGEWVLPMGDQVIGYMGHGIWWACKGGHIERYCTEAPHVEGGSYALVNANGVLIDSLEDIALGFVDGCTPLYRQGKIALMDTAGRMVTGFAFDKALSNHLGSHHYGPDNPDWRLWKLALRRLDGGWEVVGNGGSLQAVDWPHELGIEERGVGWRTQAGTWINSKSHDQLPCRLNRRLNRLAMYIPQDLSYAENFATPAFLEEKCQEHRSARLAEIGLQTLEKADQRALATLAGKRLTPFGYDQFEACQGGFVAMYHPPTQAGKEPQKSGEATPKGIDTGLGRPVDDLGVPVVLVGLLDHKGKQVLPPNFAEIDVHPEIGLIDGDYGSIHQFYDLAGHPLELGITPELETADSGFYVIKTYPIHRIYSPRHELLVEDSSELSIVEVAGGWLWYMVGHYGYHGLQIDGDSTLGPLFASQLPDSSARWLLQLPLSVRDSAWFNLTDDGYWTVDRRDKEGLYDAKGNLVVPMAYDGVEVKPYGIKVRHGKYHGLLDWSGREVLPVVYTGIWDVGCGCRSLHKEIEGKSWHCIMDENGEVVWKWQEE